MNKKSPGNHQYGFDNFWGLNLPALFVPRRISKRVFIKDREILADIKGAGCIRRFWVTGKNIGRELILRLYFDNQVVPYVEAPLSDFFGIMHNLSEVSGSKYREKVKGREAYSLNTPFLASKPHNGFTAYFPMPFSDSARIEIINDSEKKSQLYAIMDWHEYNKEEFHEPLRFSARWRREAPVPDYQDDFFILDADGPGRLVGFVHSIDMLFNRHMMRWSHAGSDNIYIDGKTTKATFLRGIGGEDTFGASYGGNSYRPQSAFFSDMPYYEQKEIGSDDWQKMVGYRFFVHDAIYFQDSIHLRFGARAHDIATTVYWYSEKPVRPYIEIPPYHERLPDQIPKGKYDLPLPDSGKWWISGPFPGLLLDQVPSGDDFNPNKPLCGRIWRYYSAKQGFVDFNHKFRPKPSNENSITLKATALAMCEIDGPEDGEATLVLGWDDELFFRLNSEEFIDLGKNDYYRTKKVSIKLKKGKNNLAVILTNTEGLSMGGWNFSCCLKAKDGSILIPQAKSSPDTMLNGPILPIDFGAGEAEPQKGYLAFVPPYVKDINAQTLCQTIDILCSPQTEYFSSPCGLMKITLATSHNSSIGFRERVGITHGPYKHLSKLLCSEVRANTSTDDTPVELILSIEGLPKGKYSMTTYHHCHCEEVEKTEIECQRRGTSYHHSLIQTAGLNPKEIGHADHVLDVKDNELVQIVFLGKKAAVVLNGFLLQRFH